MSKLNSLAAISAAVAFFAATPAIAGAISGTFTGIVTNSSVYHYGMPSTNINGQAVTGSFETAFTICPPDPNPNFSCFVPQMTVSFTVAGETHLFGQYAGQVRAFTVGANAADQLLTFYPDLGDPSSQSSLTLAGLPNAFVTGTDYVNLHPGPVIAADSTASFSLRQGLAANIQLTGVQVDGVPEPATWALLIVGYGIVGLGVRTGRKALTSVT